ncbi:putative mobilization protein [uncultured Eubacteriales bacterium]|uniref:Putative mobilization protein n=1 Tax=uncultured Eubacteriales bacterium TaxID=172733 RepID=A0A212K7N7_9FIRM|nr:putative mobilization protein [uncultured Eubacteriales bacterium]
MNRTHKITFRVSDYEHKLIQSKVKKSGTRMSDFCRYAVLGKEVRTVKGLDKCSYELNKIGNNLNQLTVLCHQRAVQNPNLEAIQMQLSDVLERIYAALGGDDDGDSQAD